jgi:hypothetical protein
MGVLAFMKKSRRTKKRQYYTPYNAELARTRSDIAVHDVWRSVAAWRRSGGDLTEHASPYSI